MTDYERLRDMLKGDNQLIYPKDITLTKLIELVDVKTGQLPKELYVPEYEVDKSYFFEMLAELGYRTEYEEDYNPYFEQFCYKVTLYR